MMMFSYKPEAFLNTWTFSNLRYCYEARRVMRWMQISLKSLNFQSFRVKMHTLCNLCFHPKGFEQFQHHLLIHLKLPSILLHIQDLGSLSPWKGKNLQRQQQERQNSNSFIKQTKKFARASRFFVHIFATAARLRCENA